MSVIWNIDWNNCPCGQNEIHVDMVCHTWFGITSVSFTEPWRWPNTKPLEWTGTLTTSQASSPELSDWFHYCPCGWQSTNPHSHDLKSNGKSSQKSGAYYHDSNNNLELKLKKHICVWGVHILLIILCMCCNSNISMHADHYWRVLIVKLGCNRFFSCQPIRDGKMLISLWAS